MAWRVQASVEMHKRDTFSRGRIKRGRGWRENIRVQGEGGREMDDKGEKLKA